MKIFRTIALTLMLVAAAGIATPATAARQGERKGVLALKNSITDDAIIYPESFERDTRKLLEGWFMKNYTSTDDSYATSVDPETSDAVIIERLAKMPTVIDMPFNSIVRNYIDRYTRRGRQQVATVLGLSLYYTPIFEQALEARQLPLELKYLPVIESGLDPNAVSRHGATGLWQFMIAAAKGFDMEVNSLVDERRDPYVSSAKAAQFLSDLYATYGDWTLAIAAYNCGPGTVNKALRRAGGDPKTLDFWSIYQYLPAETRGYVPMFIAANYVMTYYPEHNISPVLPTKPLVTDTIGINTRVHFNQISKVLNIPVEELRMLNPQFRADIIPGTPEKTYNLILPSQQIQAYIMSEPQILAWEADKYMRRITAEPGEVTGSDPLLAEEPFNPADLVPAEEAAAEAEVEAFGSVTDAPPAPASATKAVAATTAQTAPAKTSTAKGGKRRTVTHTVAEGETLAQIAAQYGVTVAEIRNANGLRRNAVRAGQKLRVETTAAVADKSTAAAGNKAATKNGAAATKVASSKSASTKAGSAKADGGSARKRNAAKGEKKRPTEHEVKSGDNLSNIAKRYGVSVEELKKANSRLGETLHPGDKVKLPKKNAAKASKSKKGGSAKGSATSRKKSGKSKKKR